VGVIYSTDLFHPPDDPDDHYDLATLFALPEIDIKAIVLDQGLQQRKEPGDIPLRQIAVLTGRSAPHAAGLQCPLRYPEDQARDQFTPGAVDLILRTLGQTAEPLYIITTGSLRDVAAAYNRQPELFRRRVARIYVNAGNSAGGDLHWNPRLDPQAYIRMMMAGLPIYWAPCFGGKETLAEMAKNGLPIQQHQGYWRFRQGDLFDALPDPLVRFFLYGLARRIPSIDDPVAALGPGGLDAERSKFAGQYRNMWSTATILHASGRKLYRKQGDWRALREAEAGYREASVFDFRPVKITVDRDLRSRISDASGAAPAQILYLTDIDHYERALFTALRNLLRDMPLVPLGASAPVGKGH
jgi:hypothetical protein